MLLLDTMGNFSVDLENCACLIVTCEREYYEWRHKLPVDIPNYSLNVFIPQLNKFNNIDIHDLYTTHSYIKSPVYSFDPMSPHKLDLQLLRRQEYEPCFVQLLPALQNAWPRGMPR